MTPENRSALDWLMAPAEELQQTFDITRSSRQATLIPREQISAFGDWRLNSRQVAALGVVAHGQRGADFDSHAD